MVLVVFQSPEILYSLFLGLHYEYSGKGITVQCVCPGPVMTDMLIGIMRDGTRMRKWNPVVPNVNTYTSSAIR